MHGVSKSQADQHGATYMRTTRVHSFHARQPVFPDGPWPRGTITLEEWRRRTAAAARPPR